MRARAFWAFVKSEKTRREPGRWACEKDAVELSRTRCETAKRRILPYPIKFLLNLKTIFITYNEKLSHTYLILLRSFLSWFNISSVYKPCFIKPDFFVNKTWELLHKSSIELKMNSSSISVVLKWTIETILQTPAIEFFNNSIDKKTV